MSRTFLAGTLAAGLLLTGCAGSPDRAGGTVAAPQGSGGPSAGKVKTPGSSAPALVPGRPMARSTPVTIKIPRIGVSAPVSEIGLRPDGYIQEPPLSRPNLAGWYKEGPTPGEIGPSVVLGHVDANGQAAVFARLKELRPGDRIQVVRQDHSTAVFAVERVKKVAKKSFPGQEVYGADLDYPALRLVTCGGDFDRSTGHYVDNVITYTRLVQS